MIQIDGNKVKLFGTKPLLELEGIILIDALVARGIFGEETVRQLYNAFGSALHVVDDEEAVKRYLRKTMEDEWNV